MLEHVGQIVGLQQVVDRNDFYFRKILCGSTEHHASDTTESIDTNANSHSFLPYL